MVRVKGKLWPERKKCLAHTPSAWSQPRQKVEFYSSSTSMRESLVISESEMNDAKHEG